MLNCGGTWPHFTFHELTNNCSNFPPQNPESFIHLRHDEHCFFLFFSFFIIICWTDGDDCRSNCNVGLVNGVIDSGILIFGGIQCPGPIIMSAVLSALTLRIHNDFDIMG